MLGLNVLTRKISSAGRILQNEGFSALAAGVWQQVSLRWKLLSARKIQSLMLDGCTFNVRRIPVSPMKLVMLQGEYEEFERKAAALYIQPELPVIELGGCIGVVACITNRLLNNPESHVVVEPNPSVISYLEESRSLNECRFEIVNAAISYNQPSVVFTPNRDLWANSLITKPGESTVTVPTVCLRDLVTGRKFDTFTLICDIEGHEYEMVLHEADILQKAHTIILETHARLIGEAKTNQMLTKLEEIGFRKIDEESFVVVMKRIA